MRALGRTWRSGPRPTRDLVLHEHDRDLLDTTTLEEAIEHAQRLRGLVPYSRAQVKGEVSAGYIDRLIEMVQRLRECKSVRRHREMRGTVQALIKENEEQRGELKRLWVVESKYKALKEQRELQFRAEM